MTTPIINRKKAFSDAIAHLPAMPTVVFSDEDVAALRAAFALRFDEPLPRTETLFAVASVGYRLAMRDMLHARLTADHDEAVRELVDALCEQWSLLATTAIPLNITEPERAKIYAEYRQAMNGLNTLIAKPRAKGETE